MPAFVKTKHQEKLWKRAKQAAGSSEKAPKWPLVTHIFKKMGGFKEAASVIDFDQEIVQESSFSREFPDHPGFPPEVRELLKSGEAEDISWHNDTMPSVGHEITPNGMIVKLWVDYPEFDEKLAEKEIDDWADENDYDLEGKKWNQLTAKQQEQLRDYCIKYQVATRRESPGNKQFAVTVSNEDGSMDDDVLETDDVNRAVAEFRNKVRTLSAKK